MAPDPHRDSKFLSRFPCRSGKTREKNPFESDPAEKKCVKSNARVVRPAAIEWLAGKRQGKLMWGCTDAIIRKEAVKRCRRPTFRLGSRRLRFPCSQGKDSKKTCFWSFADQTLPCKSLIRFASDANSATLPNNGILAAEQRNRSGICLSAGFRDSRARNGDGLLLRFLCHQQLSLARFAT
jgi:hypothetical protein